MVSDDLTSLEDAAIEFIMAKRRKKTIKNERRNALKTCSSKGVWTDPADDTDYGPYSEDYVGPHFDLHKTCVYQKPRQSSKWCSSCKEAESQHEKYPEAVRRVVRARYALIREVKEVVGSFT